MTGNGKRLYALVLEDLRLLGDLLRDAKRGEIVVRGIVVFAEMSPQKAGGYEGRCGAPPREIRTEPHTQPAPRLVSTLL